MKRPTSQAEILVVSKYSKALEVANSSSFTPYTEYYFC